MSSPSDTPPHAAPTRTKVAKRPAKPARATRPRRRGLVTALVIVGLVVLALGGWAIDAKAHEGKVARGVAIGGTGVSGDTPAELATATAALATLYQRAHVRITSPKGTLDATAAMVGLSLDQAATAEAAMAVDRDGSAIKRPVQWARSLVTTRAAPLHFTLDQAAFAKGITELAAANRIDPVEPGFTDSENGVVVVPGVKGEAIDVADLARRLQAAADTGVTPIEVNAIPAPIAPVHGDADAQAVVDKANTFVKTPLNLSVGGKSATINAKTLRGWLTPVQGPNGLEIGADQARIVKELPALVGDIGTAPVQLGFTLVDDPDTKKPKAVIIDGQNGSRCCAPDSAARVAAAIAAGQNAATLDLEVIPPDHDHAWAESLGINEEIATFTTPHPGPVGLDRVTNIHRIADTVRGMYIEPGGTFSVNGRVGQRTKEKGYVSAPVIYNGTHDEDVGGGVSQFATTFFNAAFFGGMEYDAYQSHSIFIDRYPYGREATISWPKPDLIIKNPSPYGVMVWTSYTDTSLTVSLWSTRWATGAQTGQHPEPDGPCTKVVTERTRTWVDGHTDVDKVVAIYQPAGPEGDGIKCP
jgi:vancomycin resistance protein YoaR